MQVNQQDKPVETNAVSFADLTLEERKHAVNELFEYLNLYIVRTNATKSGNVEIQVWSRT